MGMRWRVSGILRRSIRAKFLAVNVSLTLLALLALFAAFEYAAYERAMEHLHTKLERVAEERATLVAQALWSMDEDRLALILATAAEDPDIMGMAVIDQMGQVAAAVGDPDAATPALRTQASIPYPYAETNQLQEIGVLRVGVSDARLVAHTRDRLTLAALLAVLVLAAAVVSAALAHRRTIEAPLAHLLRSIERSRSEGSYHPVNWHSEDEIGVVAAAFNRMQAQRQQDEAALRQAHEELEHRVAARTAELAQARDEAQAANNAKSVFLANMSHELRTPLNSIIGFAEIMENQLLGPVGAPRYLDYAGEIRNGGQHLLSLINDLLDLSKAEAKRLTLDESEFDLREVIAQTLRMMHPRAEASGICLENTLGERMCLPICADQRKVRQVMLNLLSNAVKFTPSGGRVAVEVDDTGDDLVVAVIDTGPGIPPEDIDKVFEPFQQADASLGRHQEGTGLGLPLAKAMIERHGGGLEMRSTLGAGTRVTMCLPAARRRAVPASSRAVNGN